MTNPNQLPLAAANVDPGHEEEARFREIEIGAEGIAQIDEILSQMAELEGDDLGEALMDHFAELAARGELKGAEALKAWAEEDEYQAEAAVVIKPLKPELETASAEERLRYGMAQTALVSHVLGVPWTRHYENDGKRWQHVQPKPGQFQVEGSVGGVQLYPHNEVLPTHEGTIICSEFSTLYGVEQGNPTTATTLYDAQQAINLLSPEARAILMADNPPRYKWNGTAIEQEDGQVAHALLSVLKPVYDDQNNVLAYDLIADLDGKTMGAIDGDEEAAAALIEFRDIVKGLEAAYTVKNGQMLVWRNRRALHGRREVQDMDRHLLRSQIGEREYAEYDLVA